MAAAFKWIVVQLDTKPKEGKLEDVVSSVHWRRNASEDFYIAEDFGEMYCQTPSETDFTAYPDLTQEQVESWLDAGLNVKEIDERLLASIELQKNPPVVILPLPWLNVENDNIGK